MFRNFHKGVWCQVLQCLKRCVCVCAVVKLVSQSSTSLKLFRPPLSHCVFYCVFTLKPNKKKLLVDFWHQKAVDTHHLRRHPGFWHITLNTSEWVSVQTRRNSGLKMENWSKRGDGIFGGGGFYPQCLALEGIWGICGDNAAAHQMLRDDPR